MKLVTNKFKSGGLHEKHVVAGLSETLPNHPAPIWCHGNITVVEKVFRFVSPVKRHVSYMNIF